MTLAPLIARPFVSRLLREFSAGGGCGHLQKKHMKYEISQDRRTLKITANETEREELRNWEAEHPTLSIGSGDAESEFLESLVCNSELNWINPADTGDLTDAPMLGITGEDMTLEEIERLAKSKPGIYGSRQSGHWGGKDRHSPILERWGYMEYAVRSPLEDLRDKGFAEFVNSN